MMKKSIKFRKIMSVLTVIVILVSCVAIPVSAKTPSDAKKSVVAVFNQVETEQGSGFAIGKVGQPVEFIVTNNHVVQGEQYTTAVVSFDAASNDFAVANVYFYDVEKDVAILKLPQATRKRKAMVLCPMKYVDIDDSFAALGYPGNQVSDWKKYSEADITITKGGVKKADRLDGQDVYMLDLKLIPGNSGGPLVNSRGEVVGINTFNAGYIGKEWESYAITIDELLDVLNRDRIPVTVHGDIAWIYVIGGALLLIILALIILLLVRKKNNTGSVGMPVNNMQGGANPTVPVYDQAAANNAVRNAAGAGANAGAAANAGARVVAIGGTLNGRRYSVSGTVKIGRDASKCAIAFPVNTQGVSGVHCEISFTGSACCVKDLNSSYGTYTSDGKRLAPNVPQLLRSGDKFYLASPENTFEVKF